MGKGRVVAHHILCKLPFGCTAAVTRVDLSAAVRDREAPLLLPLQPPPLLPIFLRLSVTLM